MSTPTATMPAPKQNGLEIVYQTLGLQTEQAEALKKIVKEVIDIKEEQLVLYQRTSDRLDDIEKKVTLQEDECVNLQRSVSFKASELAKEYLDSENVSVNYRMSKIGQFRMLVYKRLKNRFNAHKYTLIPHIEFGKAMEFVNDIKLNDFSELETRETVKQIEIKQLEGKND